ncbi:unnamed protein product, partial [Scytosiphon promiscuus]
MMCIVSGNRGKKTPAVFVEQIADVHQCLHCQSLAHTRFHVPVNLSPTVLVDIERATFAWLASAHQQSDNCVLIKQLFSLFCSL